MVLRRFLKIVAAAIAVAPLALAALLVFGSSSPSLAVVAPGGFWVIAAIFAGPAILGVIIWRVASLIR